MTLKQQYWKNGNIFVLSTGEVRFVWNKQLINRMGCCYENNFSDDLRNLDSTVAECVIQVYSPNEKAGYFDELIKTRNSTLLWQKSDYIFTLEEIKAKLNIPSDKELLIIRKK